MQRLVFIIATLSLATSASAEHRQLGGLRPGLEVRATTPAYPDEVFTGELTFIGTEVDAGTRILLLEVTLPNADARLRPGMFMEVTLVLGERETLTVPESAVISQGPSQLVYRLTGEEGRAGSGWGMKGRMVYRA